MPHCLYSSPLPGFIPSLSSLPYLPPLYVSLPLPGLIPPLPFPLSPSLLSPFSLPSPSRPYPPSRLPLIPLPLVPLLTPLPFPALSLPFPLSPSLLSPFSLPSPLPSPHRSPCRHCWFCYVSHWSPLYLFVLHKLVFPVPHSVWYMYGVPHHSNHPLHTSRSVCVYVGSKGAKYNGTNSMYV